MAGGNDIFNQIGKEVFNESAKEKGTKPRPNYLEDRESRIAAMATGKRVNLQLLKVDPATCKMWPGHNRDYGLLSEARCRDLIDSFIAQGEQNIPAIVRRLDGDEGEYRYEVICGARRHWAATWMRENNYPQFDYLIEVKQLTDEEAFRLSDIENRAREDISDIERARDYASALDRYYDSQSAMAKRLEVDKGWLSRFLFLATLPGEVVAAFDHPGSVRVDHGRKLKPRLEDRKVRPKVIERAKALAAEQKVLAKAGQQPIAAAVVLRRLMSDAKHNAPAKQKKQTIRSNSGAVEVSWQPKGEGRLVATLHVNTASQKEVLAAVKQMLDEAL